MVPSILLKPALKFCLYARTDMQTSILASVVLYRQELLRGPLFYVIIMTAVTVVFWRDSPVGMMVLSLMCGGDGLADIIGRRYGTAKLPFNKAKSWAGSLAMFTGKSLFLCLTADIVILLQQPSLLCDSAFTALE